MPLKIQSTTIEQDGKGTAIVELSVADIPDVDHAEEYVLLRMKVRDDHNFFSGFQGDAIKSAIESLEKLRSELNAKTSNK